MTLRARRLVWGARAMGCLALILLAGIGRAGCKLAQMIELPVTMTRMKPMVTAKINGADVTFLADSGAFFSVISPAAAAEFKLRLSPAPMGIRLVGVGGDAQTSMATVKDFELQGMHAKNLEFLVGGSDSGGGGVGLLGQNFFQIGDVEYDLANGVIRLIREDGCGKSDLTYWDTGAALAHSMMDIRSTTPASPHTTGNAYVNGVRIEVTFDTGAGASFVSLHAAKRAGIDVNAPGATYTGFSQGIGSEKVKTWIVPVTSFKIGDEEIRNTHLRVLDSSLQTADMLIGADFFLSHHIFVASKQNRLFFTYNGGPVFNLGAHSVPAIAESGEETDAGALARRGAASTSRHDFEHGIVDLSRAIELQPDQPDYWYERGLAHWEAGETALAAPDFDRAIELKPDDVPALVARAEFNIRNRQRFPNVIEDLNAADAAAAGEADIRLRMGMDYGSVDLAPAAVSQLDRWIAAHGADARLVDALRERCAVRAGWGQQLTEALEDCNKALHLIDKKDPGNVRILNSRGLIRLRLGDYDKSVTDFDAALALNPKDAAALYGRGIDEHRRGKVAQGDADQAAAVALAPKVPDWFGKHGFGT